MDKLNVSALRRRQPLAGVDWGANGLLPYMRQLAAAVRAETARRPLTQAQRLHQSLLRRSQSWPSLAPVRARPAAPPGQPRPPQAAADEPPALPSASTPLWRGGARLAAAASAGTAPRLALRTQLSPIPYPLAPPGGRQAAGPARAAFARRAAGSQAESLASPHAPLAQPGQELRRAPGLTSAAGAAGFDVVHSPDGNAVLTSGTPPQRTGAASPSLAPHATGRAAANIDPIEFKAAFEEMMRHQARLPPSGITGVDWRVAVPWAGVKTSG